MFSAVEYDQNTHLLCACIPFCHKPTRFIYYRSDVTVLSKYPNTLRNFSELLVRDVKYRYWTTRHRSTSCDMFSEIRASI